jgi:hypothetical protein
MTCACIVSSIKTVKNLDKTLTFPVVGKWRERLPDLLNLSLLLVELFWR